MRCPESPYWAWQHAPPVLAGDRSGILCPVTGDVDLSVDWVPCDIAADGEIRLACQECGETNLVLGRGDCFGVA